MKDKIQTFVGIVGRNLTGQNNILSFLRDIWVRRSEKVEEMKETKELKKCPFCGSNSGYYMMETVYRGLFFDYDDTPIGASEDVTVYSGKRCRCIDCNKILPKKMFDE